MSQVQKYSTYALTVRPKNGISDSQVTMVVDFIKKYCTYWKIVTEKLEHERHVHAAMYLKTPTARSNVLTSVMRLADKRGAAPKVRYARLRATRPAQKSGARHNFEPMYCSIEFDGTLVL